MKKEPEKFLYIYLQDATTNPKLCFEVHQGPLPEKRYSRSRTALLSLQKKSVLEDVAILDDVGFWIVIGILSERNFKSKENWAMIAFISEGAHGLAFDVDEQIYRHLEGGEFYTFVPLRPFDSTTEKVNTDENRLDPVLWMRTGLILANALL